MARLDGWNVRLAWANGALRSESYSADFKPGVIPSLLQIALRLALPTKIETSIVFFFTGSANPRFFYFWILDLTRNNI
jgi:hypothetical protein